jgi:hypothetical protein
MSDVESKIPSIEPFLGRLLIEIIEEDVEQYMKEKAGIKGESLIVLPDSFTETHRVPLHRGTILKKAPDAFGEAFKKKMGGDIGTVPEVGDLVYFVPNQTYPIDIDKKYHLLNDTDIVGRGV